MSDTTSVVATPNFQPENPKGTSRSKHEFSDRCKPAAIRNSNILAAKAVADAIRTSLGPKGMDKMIQEGKGDVTITNDGATILKRMKLVHPAARMLVELSKAQDVEAGDGTTTVVVLAGSLLDACSKLLSKGIHPTTISESFNLAAKKAAEVIENMSVPVDMNDRNNLLKIASTSLNSKVVSQYSSVLSPIAVDAVLRIQDDSLPNCVNLDDLNIVNKLGGTVEDTELVDGIIIDRRVESLCNVFSVDNAKIGFIQFCIAPPKAEMEQSIIVSDYTQMDRVLKDERKYVLEIVKKIKASGCNVLLVQKNVLRDCISDLALHFFSKMNIMIVKSIPKERVEFICKTIGCKPVANVEYFDADCLGAARKAEEICVGASRIVHITGIEQTYKTVSILLRGSNKLVLDEAERSLHDALCVVRCLVKKKALVAGGGAPEIEVGQKMALYSNSLMGESQYCFRAFADAMDIIPYTLAENAGLNPIETVTELRHMHANGHINAGINIKKGCVPDIMEEDVMQPLLVSLNSVSLAAETVCSILKIDDVVAGLV